MEEARTVLERLARIEALEQEQAPASVVLDELRGLVADAEEWARRERPGPRAEAALAACRGALDAAPLEVAMM